MMNKFKKFETKEQLLDDLVFNIVKVLKEEIEKKGKASLLVSGGNTPKPLFKKLSNTPLKWEKVTVALVDDRWVPANHQDSNELLVKENLIQNYAKDASFIGMYFEGKEANSCDEECSNLYKQKVFPFDVIILGMGLDYHTASLFPNNERLKEAYNLENEKLCISIKPKTAPHDRMSLTLKGILSAKNIVLHIEGEEKLKVYEEALNSNDIFKTPISAVLNNKEKNIEVYHT